MSTIYQWLLFCRGQSQKPTQLLQPLQCSFQIPPSSFCISVQREERRDEKSLKGLKYPGDQEAILFI